jgi:hypothetical protein
LKAETVGLVTLEDFRKKRMNLEVSVEVKVKDDKRSEKPR